VCRVPHRNTLEGRCESRLHPIGCKLNPYPKLATRVLWISWYHVLLIVYLPRSKVRAQLVVLGLTVCCGAVHRAV